MNACRCGCSLSLAHVLECAGVGHTVDRFPSLSSQLTSFDSPCLSVTSKERVSALIRHDHVAAMAPPWFHQTIVPSAKRYLSFQAPAPCTHLIQLALTNEKLVALLALPNPLCSLSWITRYGEDVSLL